ncbi:uncharacterized protein YpmS [Neobacillus niacini]|uniref:hypothetical protein n=1 Tax=Neobacillus niacini TaxID=86668 RepID=UPI0028564296|nr:hypothetical protein [Neobacillus niacini]MDR7077612.1 uncharacterized protein YpmS [Neobacillus niacini]
MTRIELYHQKTKQISWKWPFFFILTFIILTVGFFVFQHYYQSTIKIESPEENVGSQVVIHLPDGKELFTYENYIFEKDGRTYYKGERNTIDVTGGTVTYENWE